MKLLLVLCLVAGALAETFIVEGEDASVGEFPWQGSLTYLGSHTCGCVLIDADWALTAAHCVDGRDTPPNFRAWFGVHDRSTNQGVQHEVSQIIIHPDFVNSAVLSWPNDVALLALTESADLGDPNTAAVPMSSRVVDYAHDNCVISGWGRTCGTCALPNILQKAPMRVMTLDECRQQWVPINDVHVCITDVDTPPTSASCSGDSGGPLVCEGSPELVGVTSWGASGCLATYPSVYARISVQCSWIEGETGVSCA